MKNRLWWTLGAALVACNVGLLGLSGSFHYDSPFNERPIPAAVAVLLVASAIYVVVFFLARSSPPPLRGILAVALLARLPLLLAQPIQEDDLYRYIWDGRVTASGLDPYAFSPDEIRGYEAGEGAFLPDAMEALTALVALKNRTPEQSIIFERVNNPAYATIYPPVTQCVFLVHGLLVPVDTAPEWQTVCMKALLGIFDAATLIGLILLLSILRKPIGLCVLYAWCPLVLKELSNSGHMDAIPTAFVIFALCAQCRGRAVVYGALLALAVAAKIYAILLLPLALRTLGWRRSAMALVAFTVTTAAIGIPLTRGEGRHDQTIVSFALSWENHDAVFFWLYGAWSFLIGDEFVRMTARGATFAVGKGYLATLVTTGCGVLATCVYVTRKLRPNAVDGETPRAAFAILAAVFLLGPLGFPWYFVWCAPLLPFVRLRTWCLLPGLLMIYYLRFWYDYQYPDGYAGFADGVDFFDYAIASVEFGFFYAILFLEAWRAKKKSTIL